MCVSLPNTEPHRSGGGCEVNEIISDDESLHMMVSNIMVGTRA